MNITIDNLTGLGPLDYTAAIAAGAASTSVAPFKITRTLNAPSILTGSLDLIATTLPVPRRRARIVVSAANGTVLFTGYLAAEAVALYAGVSTTGTVYRYTISAVSDEWLLDKLPPPYLGNGLGTSAGTALVSLTDRTGTGILNASAVTGGAAVGVFSSAQTAVWSANAADLASSAYAAYRVLDGALTLDPAGTVTHALNFDTSVNAAGGAISVAALKTSSVKELANDVTLSGAMEPTAYIEETFLGDGTTTVFDLTEAPFRARAAQRTLVTDAFNEAAIDTQIWNLADPGSRLSLTSNGLTMSGGNGYDGQTTLTAIDFIELGGSLVIEAGNVMLGGASEGVLCGLFNGLVETANCFAGYGVSQSSGATILTPLVNGAATGTAFTMQSGHAYTLRIRLHCPEMQRVLQTYYAMADGVLESFGGGGVPAPCTLVFDLIDLGAAANTPATVLYDGSTEPPIAVTPATCAFAAVDAVQLFGSVGYVRVTQSSSAWVVSTLPSGVKLTRLIGIAGEGVDCKVSATGVVTFFAGRVPVAEEYVTISYRGSSRAVTRVEDAASVALEVIGNAPGTARWIGKVLKPLTRSSADCENAALAVLSFATSRAAAISGTYDDVNLQQGTDVWPGDVLALTQDGVVTAVVVRKVEITRTPACPETLEYHVAFANDWAEGLGLTLSQVIAANAILPSSALTTTQLGSGGPGPVLPNLQQLQLLTASATALQIDAGQDPPAGGGFEVRRRDDAFGPNIAQDLVLRSPVRSFSVPREAQTEQYFTRMYDGSSPPLYSRFSSAVFINLPIA